MADQKKYCPGFPKVDIQPIDCSAHFMVNLKVKVNEDHTVSPDESDLVDLDAMTQTYKDQCGMEAAKRLLKLGQAQPSDFADDGKGNYDASVIPETPQARANAAVVAGVQLDAVKAKYGIDPNAKLTEDQVNAIIKEYIQQNAAQFVKPSAEQTQSQTQGGDK